MALRSSPRLTLSLFTEADTSPAFRGLQHSGRFLLCLCLAGGLSLGAINFLALSTLPFPVFLEDYLNVIEIIISNNSSNSEDNPYYIVSALNELRLFLFAQKSVSK